MFSKVCSGAKSSVTGMARRSDVENGYSGWKRAAWLSLGVALMILVLIGVCLAGIKISFLQRAWIISDVAAGACGLGAGVVLTVPLIGGGMILIPAIGYHFKKVVHSDVGQGEL